MGPDKDHGPYVWQPHPNTNQGMHRWAEEHIMRNHGALGELYPYRFSGNGFLEGGGTIPWLGLVNKGLYSTEETSWGGWSGRFSAVKQKNIWSRHKDIKADEARNTDFYVYTEVSDNWTDPETGTHYNNNYAPVWRWRRAMLNNCQARFDWCVKPYKEANHHPKAAFNGDTSDTIVRLTAKPDEIVALDATTSKDPDGDALDFLWWIYPEAGTYAGDVYIAKPHHAKTAVTIPSDAAGKQIHFILQVSDKNPIASLFDYRRVVIDVED